MGGIHYPEWILLFGTSPIKQCVYIFLIINHSLQLVHNEEQNSLCFRDIQGNKRGIFRYLALTSLLTN